VQGDHKQKLATLYIALRERCLA